ncbi:transmembrane protein 72 [Paramormyrops kingsleyae]|uniref:transmembrane protein 72 n=1 Tax=Paramormyrops kingsleyae TaxID=1676925 RepID=UPI000CD662BB|nr:transmembrane protein 72 [Paramormyrops kingsleyae]
MGSSVLWVLLECVCRVLGVSTAAVLCAVGIETLNQGKFQNLAVYLLVSSGGVSVLEVSYFVDSLLVTCLPCPPKWIIFVLWKKLSNLGGFQKFLYYTIMAVVCFLHPVLAWHAVIPGTMLLVTGVAYFILSKNKSSAKAGSNPETCAPDTRAMGPSYSILHLAGGRRPMVSPYWERGGKDGSQAEAGVTGRALGRGSSGVLAHQCFRESKTGDTQEDIEMQEYETSDKAPMVRM